MKYDVSVRTEIWRSNGRLFFDMGTMVWPGVDDEVVAWLAGSCKTTAFWLLDLREAIGPDSYTLKYRTVVTREDGSIHSDTSELSFERMTYEDVVRFERWALGQLSELCDLFEARHSTKEPTQRRSKVRQIFKWIKQTIVAKSRP